MTKIQGRAGQSLSDQYDTPGQAFQLDELEPSPIHLVHDMAQVIQSENLQMASRLVEDLNVAQNTDIAATIGDLPDGVSRVMGIMVRVETTGRVAHANVGVRNSRTGREFPLWWWHQNVGSERVIVYDAQGTGVATHFYLQPSQGFNDWLPSLALGDSQPELNRMDEFYLRGTTTGFGAGTVDVRADILLAFTENPGISAHGVRVPSW